LRCPRKRVNPNFTTIADFVSSLEGEIVPMFRDVLLVCDELGLIGREMFAVDGVKMPSNASKEWSGTRADMTKKAKKMELAIGYLVRRHRAADRAKEDPALGQARQRQIKTLRAAVKKVKGFLEENDDKVGPSGRVKKSNVTDNESAKMKTTHGVIQGYAGVAVVDAKHQVVVHARAYGEAQEHGLLVPMLEGTRESFRTIGGKADVLKQAKVAADSGYHSEANAKYLFEQGIDGYLADNLFRKRDPRFATAARHVPQRDAEPWARRKTRGLYRSADFRVAEDLSHAICPAGKRLYRSGRPKINGFQAVMFKGARSATAAVASCARGACDIPSVRPCAQSLCSWGGFPENRKPTRANEVQDRHRARTPRIRPTPRNSGTRLRQHQPGAPTQALQPARHGQSEHAVAPVLPGPQHRQAAAIRWLGKTKCRKERNETLNSRDKPPDFHAIGREVKKPTIQNFGAQCYASPRWFFYRLVRRQMRAE
jgi:hypothetical protein